MAPNVVEEVSGGLPAVSIARPAGFQGWGQTAPFDGRSRARFDLRAADGTPLSGLLSTPDGAENAPVIALAGGVGAPSELWLPLLRYLGDRYTFLTWDYRGLAGGPVAGGFEVERHAADLVALLDAAGVERCTLIGWSVGVQVALESVPLLRDRIAAMVLIAGSPGRPYRHLAPAAVLARGAAPAMRLLRRVAGDPLQRHRVVALVRKLRLLHAEGDLRFAERLAETLTRAKPDAVAAILRELAVHDASALASAVRVPALVIAGERDPLTPVARMHELARALPDSEVLVVRGAGHFVPIERPDLVNLTIERFLEDAGIDPSRAVS